MLPGHASTAPPDPRDPRVTAIVGGLLAAGCFATAIMTSARSARLIGAPSTLAGVMSVGLLITLPIVVLTADHRLPPPETLPILLIAGAGNVFGLLFEYIGLRSGKIGLVGSLAAAEGAVAAILSVLAGELLGPVEGIGVAIVALGVVLAALAPDAGTTPGDRSTRVAIVFGALAGLSFGVGLYATGRLGSELALGWAVVPPRILGVALIAVPLVATSRLAITRPALPFIVAAGAAEVGGFLAFAWGARDSIAISSALAAQFASIAAVVAWLVLGERLSRLQWAGVAGVAVGVALIALGSA
jgi:drug/metabolite transporter (DMT)-like permease